MGKKKSAALIVLFTVVLVGLVFMSVASFPVSAVYNYNSLLSMIDLSTDLGGGYTAVYYPEGVISQEEYNALAADYEDKKDEADAPENPKDLYHQYGGVYIENESWNSDEEDVTRSFPQRIRQRVPRIAEQVRAEKLFRIFDQAAGWLYHPRRCAVYG